jgi:hypothetical protein
MSRPDLLALTEDALAALANRGLVKRALKDADAVVLSEDAEGVVAATHPDGARTDLPAGVGLESANCTCGAHGVCRHVLASVLAYQRREQQPTTLEQWSPGEFADDALVELLGARVMTAARRTLRAGYVAKVRRPTAEQPAPSVELPACTVRFLVPRQLDYARTDAARGSGDETIALAVWAFRAADERSPDRPDVELEVGGDAAPVGAGTGLGSALDLVSDVLSEGVVHIGPAFDPVVTRVRRDLDERGLRWPLLAVDALAEQLDAYRQRGARYRPENVAELLAELVARQAAVTNEGDSLVIRVLGTEEPAETPLRRVRLTSLGCRVTGTDDDRTVDVFFAHPDSSSVLVLRRRWEVASDESIVGADLGPRRVAGATIAALARGNVVTESAHRGANRMLRLATGRIGRTTVSPSDGDWAQLPEALVVRDFVEAARQLAELPPRLVRPRVEAELVRVVAIHEVHSVGYRPGDQRLDAVVSDAAGSTALVSLRYDRVTPGALDALATAFAAEPRFVSGSLRRTRGGIVVDPYAVVTNSGVVVPDLVASDGSATLELAGTTSADPLTAALDAANALLAETVHRGLRQLPAGFADRLRDGAQALTRVGLHQCAEALSRFAASIGHEHAVASWADAQIRMTVTADAR